MINDINEDFELVWDVLQEYRDEITQVNLEAGALAPKLNQVNERR